MSEGKERAKVKVHHFQEMKQRSEKIAMITAYDYPTALFAEQARIDAVLVGDSLGMVALGYRNTIPVTMDEMIHHTKAVSRGLKTPFLISDMPFMSYSVSKEQALSNAARLIQEGGAEAVKIEGGISICDTIRAIADAGIPVMGHIGLTPQSVNAIGGFKIQGRGDEAVEKLLADARAVEQAGAFSIVLEAIDSEAVNHVIQNLNIPSIGIGANRNCDGQILVISDVLGMIPGGRTPKLAKQYSGLGDLAISSLVNYIKDVKNQDFPGGINEY